MSSIEVYDPEEKPVKFDFQIFLKHLRNKKADPVIRYIKSFLRNFNQKQWTADEQSKLIIDFKDFIVERMKEYEPFSLMNKNDFENSISGVEKLIITKLFEQIYSPEISSSKIDPSHKQDLEYDDILETNYKEFEHLTAEELDVDQLIVSKGGQFIDRAGSELNKMNNFKTPRAKIICILNCCKILFELIKKNEQSQNADEFLPLLIYTVLKTKISNLYSNLMFIDRFCFNKTSEVQYYLVSLNATAEYIKKLSESAPSSPS